MIFAAILAGIAVEAIFVVDVLVGDSPFEKIQALEALEADKQKEAGKASGEKRKLFSGRK